MLPSSVEHLRNRHFPAIARTATSVIADLNDSLAILESATSDKTVLLLVGVVKIALAKKNATQDLVKTYHEILLDWEKLGCYRLEGHFQSSWKEGYGQCISNEGLEAAELLNALLSHYVKIVK